MSRGRAKVGYSWPRWLIGDAELMLNLFPLLLGALLRSFCSRRHLIIENLLLRQQLQAALRTRPRLALRNGDKLFWLLVRRLDQGWRRHLLMVRPATVIRWHRQGWRLYWRWRSGPRMGRPHLKAEVKQLIRTMAIENPLWGTQRIRGELLKLGIIVSARSIRRYRQRGPSRPPSQSWRTFLANHAQSIWAADLFVVHTLSFHTLYVIFFISHDRRQLIHFEVAAHPNAAWIWRQVLEATPWGRWPRYLIRDRDRVWGSDFAARAAAIGIETVLTPFRAPNANSIGERVVGTLRRECLDHMIIFSERHLKNVLTEFVGYYNRDRPHRALRLETPLPANNPAGGEVQTRPVLGGLHHVYERAA